MRADILAWAVPAIFGVFSVGFALLWRLGESLRWWSGCFALAACGFAMTVVPSAPGAVLKPVFEDTLFLLALAGVNVAFALRNARLPNWSLLAALVGTGSLSTVVSLAVFDSARYEIFCVQTVCALLMLVSAFEMRRCRRPIDHALFWLCIAIATSLILQNVLFIARPDAPLTVSNWRDSPWGFVFQLSGAATGLALAFAVLFANALDVIDRLRDASQMDALTHVLNRRGLDQRAEGMRASAGMEIPFSLVLADLDHFKQVNDRFGHEAGDAVLCGFATLVQCLVGHRGCVARMGGEEFAVLLAGHDRQAAHRFAEILRHAARKVDWPGALAGTRITSSFGVVEMGSGESLSVALGRADVLLYAAKTRGRDRVASDPVPRANESAARLAYAPLDVAGAR